MKPFLYITLAINSIALAACVLLFLAGSLELEPTAEQDGAARLVWGLFSGLFFTIELAIVVVLKKLHSKS